MIEISTLPNGLRVVTESMAGARSVTAGFWVGTGSRDEPLEHSGASHFLEHLLFKGSEQRSAREISEAIDAVGGDLNASTAHESTVFHVRTLDEDAALGLDLLCETVWSPLLRAEDVEVERQVILEEIAQHEDDPSDLVHELWASAVFPDHPLGRETLGGEDTIRALDQPTIAAFWSRHYRPGNVVLAAAGNLDHDTVLATATARLGGLAAGGARPLRAAPAIAAEPLAVEEDDTEQVNLVLGVRALPADDPDRHALAVLDHAVGGGLSSRLWQKVREDRGLAYSVYSERAAYEGAGTFALYVGTTPEHLEEVLDLLRGELDDLAAHGITARERDIAVGHLVGELALSLEDSASRMGRIGRSLLQHGSVLPVDDVVARLRAVTLEDVARVCERTLRGTRTLAVIGPVDERDLL